MDRDNNVILNWFPQGGFFSLAPQCREVKAQGELYVCTPEANRNCVLVKQLLSLPAGWMLNPSFQGFSYLFGSLQNVGLLNVCIEDFYPQESTRKVYRNDF